MHATHIKSFQLCLIAMLALLGCERGHQSSGAEPRRAQGSFERAPGITLEGRADLAETEGGVEVRVAVTQAPPGPKGIHIHERGNCSDIPGKSMGEHFAPGDKTHGLPSDPIHHMGDLGNVDIGDDGAGKLAITVSRATLEKNDQLSLLGKALVIHEKRDVGTGPSGESGNPIACAVIGEAAAGAGTR